jgi:citrate lyase subunit beta/citryl-CoA lyase
MECEMLMRSLLFVPGHNERLLASAARLDADLLLLDIEDSVQPESNKQTAREMIKEKVSAGMFKNKALFPRVNDRESGELLQDIYQLTIPGIHGFMYPKSKTGEDIYFFDKLLETIEYEKKIPVGTYKIIALIETASAVLHAEEICKASNRVVAVAFGCEDYVTDLEGIHDRDGLSIYTPRAVIAMAARASGVVPIDTVHIKVHDLDDLEQNLILSKKLGFEGMLVLNPKELPLVHKYYSPSEQEIADAEEMLRFVKEAEEENKGVTVINGKFVGPPMLRAALKVLKKQEMIKRRK